MKLFGLVFILIWSVSLQAAEPQWIDGSGLARYQSERYLSAVGEGDNREDARKNAIARLAEQLKVNISSESEIRKKFQASEGQASSSESMNIRINTQVNLQGLEGIKVVEQYHQPESGRYFAYVILDREQNASNLAFAIESQFEQIRTALQQAKHLIASARPAAGIRKLLKASYGFSSIDQDIALHRLFAKSTMNSMLKSDRRALAQQFEQYLSQVFRAVELRVIGPDHQPGSPELGVRDLFMVAFSYNGLPLAQVPVKVVAEDAGTRIDADDSSNARGELAVRIRSFPYTGKTQNKIRVKLDLDETALAVQSPSAELSIQLSQKSETSILLKSKITNRFNEYLYLTVNDGLSSVLSQQHYNVVSDDEGYAGNTDYVVSVKANAMALPGYGGLQFVKFNGVVSVRSNKTGRLLKTIRINAEATKAGGLSVEQAAEKAASRLVDAIKPDLLQTLEKSLGRD